MTSNSSNAHASVPEVRKRTESTSLDLVRGGESSIEEELQQRASLLAVDNANLRTMLVSRTYSPGQANVQFSLCDTYLESDFM